MRSKSIDYFENSRRATYVQQQYAIRNPKRFRKYGEFCWGITASDGPGPATLKLMESAAAFTITKPEEYPGGRMMGHSHHGRLLGHFLLRLKLSCPRFDI